MEWMCSALTYSHTIFPTFYSLLFPSSRRSLDFNFRQHQNNAAVLRAAVYFNKSFFFLQPFTFSPAAATLSVGEVVFKLEFQLFLSFLLLLLVFILGQVSYLKEKKSGWNFVRPPLSTGMWKGDVVRNLPIECVRSCWNVVNLSNNFENG